MLDFVRVKTASPRKDVVEVYPEFNTNRSKDLMIKGRKFYAIYNNQTGLWSKDEYLAQVLIDKETQDFANSYSSEDKKIVKLLSNFSSKKLTEWQSYCNALPDNYQELDGKIIFSNTEVKKNNYATFVLPYAIQQGDTSAYEKLIGTLYNEEEKKKLEWAIGAIISGVSTSIQKFIVLYGQPGSGKSTFLNIVQKMFEGYCGTFDSKLLTSGSSEFALEPFKDNPLIMIEHDGDLSNIQDNTKLNSIVSHEVLSVNEKFKSIYKSKFRSFLFMGTNNPVRITNAKSGILRRLIDVYPSGRTLPVGEYDDLVEKVNFELGAIAYHCLQVYDKLGPKYYNNYIPTRMLVSTNIFYNFIDDDFFYFVENDPLELDSVWRKYKAYCEYANIKTPYTKMYFTQELKNYYQRYDEKAKEYKGFEKDKFKSDSVNYISNQENWIELKEQDSVFDVGFNGCKAQYATKDGKPVMKWDDCNTKLSDINTEELHYVQIGSEYIVIDFDLKDENGNKSLPLNLKEANKWPKTYCEVSMSGQALHLVYLYSGDTSKLSRLYSKDIEIKVFTGNSSLRRKLSLCNRIPVATINSGLPQKEEKKMVSNQIISSERALRYQIARNLNKEIHEYTKPSVDFIYKILEDAYNSNLVYDVTDMFPDIQAFANNSKHNAEYCINVCSKMKLKSKVEPEDNKETRTGPIIFFDIEVYPNLFVVCWKKDGAKEVTKLINPSVKEVEGLLKFKLVGFNNRKYDNHILYAKLMGYSNEALFDLSQKIVNEGVLKHGFVEAYNLSYTDIYDFMSSVNKASLKKWEIKLGIHHMEMNLPWDQPVPEDKFDLVADYCANDVIATEATFHYKDIQSDWTARQILAELSGLTVNDTTNSHTTKLIVGSDRTPQEHYIYTDLSTIFPGYEFNQFGFPKEKYKEGVKIVSGKSYYKGEDPGEGGYVYAKTGIWYNVGLFDVASMHPSSIINLNLFGDEYTARFRELVNIRLRIKHKLYDKVKKLFDGKLAKYLGDDKKAKELSTALKTAINSVYGLTSAAFPNKLRDPRNVDNIVAKRGALFMIDLKEAVEAKGYTVVHIKTDSIKIANVDNYIHDFVMEFGKKYGYDFEYEARYKKMCLVNESTYIALEDMADGKEITPFWTATGAQFAVPFVFKTLFSHEEITHKDLCEVKSVTSALYLDYNECLGDEHDYRFVGRVGEFVPIAEGHGGAILLRDAGDGKFSSVTGTKGYRFLESEMVETNGLWDYIDMNYFRHLVDDAMENIAKFGDPEAFRNVDDVSSWLNPPEYTDEPLPFN